MKADKNGNPVFFTPAQKTAMFRDCKKSKAKMIKTMKMMIDMSDQPPDVHIQISRMGGDEAEAARLEGQVENGVL